LLLFLLYLPLF